MRSYDHRNTLLPCSAIRVPLHGHFQFVSLDVLYRVQLRVSGSCNNYIQEGQSAYFISLSHGNPFLGPFNADSPVNHMASDHDIVANSEHICHNIPRILLCLRHHQWYRSGRSRIVPADCHDPSCVAIRPPYGPGDVHGSRCRCCRSKWSASCKRNCIHLGS